MDWAVLSPEINSARMYAGPGSAPLIAAATGWAALAAQLGTTAADFGGVVDGLTATWLGPSSLAMMTSASHYRSWLMVTAEQAMQTAVQAQAAVAAYETAVAATVPPPLIAANRAQLMVLIATNFLGINTPAIMATEAQYMEMWAQDVAAMFGYQAASATASQLTPFTPPAPTTTGVQPAGISQAAGGAGTVLSDLSSFTPQSFSDLTGAVQALTGLASLAFSPVGAVMDEGLWGSPQWPSPASAAATDAAGAADAAAAANAMTIGMPGVNAPNVAVNLGGASAVGRLSVPQSWSTAVEKPPVVALNTTPILPGSEGSPGMPGVPGMFPPVAKGGSSERVRYGFPVKGVIHNHPSAG